MKKTLLVTLDYPPMVGGVAHYYANVVQHLPNVRLLDNAKSQLLFSGMVWPRWLKGLWRTWREVRKQEIEHILVGQILPVGTIALILKRLTGTPYTVMTHAMDITLPFGPEGSSRKQRLVKKILAHADAVTTVSTYTQAQLITIGVPTEKIALVHPCPHVEEPKGAQDVNDTSDLGSKKVVLTVARLVERKGIDRAIDAMAEVVKTHQDVQYVVVGEGSDLQRLQNLVTKHELEDVVTFVGGVSPDALAQWYKRCDMFVMPSREMSSRDVEGFGIVFLEAGSFGKPVIGGRSGGVPDAIEDGVTGYLVDPESSQEIAQRIIELLDDPAKAAAMGKAGQERVQKEFQWPQQIKKIEALLQ